MTVATPCSLHFFLETGSTLAFHEETPLMVTTLSASEQAFDEVVKMLLNHFGQGWLMDAKANRSFVQGTVALLNAAEGLHLIGEPGSSEGAFDFDVWIDFPVNGLMVADDVAFSLFSGIAEDIFVSTRILEDSGVRYRFLTGTVRDGHLGSFHLTGPHALDFVTMHRLRVARGLLFNA